MLHQHTSTTDTTASRAAANQASHHGIARPAVTTTPAQPVTQLKLKIGGLPIDASVLSLVSYYINAEKDEAEFYKQSGEKKGKRNIPFLRAQKYYAQLRGVHPSVPKMLRQLKLWARDAKDHDFDTWEQAGRDAFKVATDAQKAASKVHPPSPPGSPFTTGQDEYHDHLNGPGRDAEHMKATAKWNELKVHGQIGEYAHQQHLESTGVPFYDANQALGYNAPGIDTLSHSTRPFGQSKMHLGTVETAEEMVPIYLSHISHAPEYATKFLTRLFSDAPSAAVIRQKLADINAVWDNKQLTRLSAFATDKDWRVKKGEESPLEPGTDSNGDIRHTAPVELVVQGMVFPVPSDVYAEIPLEYKEWFSALPNTLDWYRKVKAGMEYRFAKAPKTEQEKDGDYTGD